MEQADTDIVHELESHWEALCNQIHVRRLLDKMRSYGVFSKDEYEEIMNDTLNPTSIRKASCFLDNLQRKGRDGYNVFLECLVETHPNVYRRLTGQEPEAPVREPISGSYTTAPRLRFANEIEDLYQEVEDLQRELGFSQQLKNEHKQAIESLNQRLKTANVKAERCEQIEKLYRKERNKVKHLEMQSTTLLGNSLLHKEEKEQAERNLAQKRKEVNELERRLQDAQNHAEMRRQIWHKSCLDKQQLKVAREEMLQRMSTMEEKLKQAKRQEDVVSAIDVTAEDFHVDQYTQATLNILREELQNYKEKCEESEGSLLKARNELHCRDTEFEKCKSENEELLEKRLSAEALAETFKKHYNITWHELNKVKQERLRIRPMGSVYKKITSAEQVTQILVQ
ncbi:caspase recruitment domain-containing protein 9-like [Asterias rubens]|uniref:caspase recruitment domain-containing protein 9-like n=1 Tax=Asterias rubens TaxID=7604 RepID=UPI001455C536|nr:caspase recruitment domain-containing protein 9-like [Asterias rubens]